MIKQKKKKKNDPPRPSSILHFGRAGASPRGLFRERLSSQPVLRRRSVASSRKCVRAYTIGASSEKIGSGHARGLEASCTGVLLSIRTLLAAHELLLLLGPLFLHELLLLLGQALKHQTDRMPCKWGLLGTPLSRVRDAARLFHFCFAASLFAPPPPLRSPAPGINRNFFMAAGDRGLGGHGQEDQLTSRECSLSSGAVLCSALS